MLFVLPFLVMAIAFLSGYFSLESLQSVQVKGVINMAYINQLDKFPGYRQSALSWCWGWASSDLFSE